MAAYGLDERFKDPRYCFRLLDPAAYDIRKYCKSKKNKYPFDSSAPRVTLATNPSYVDALYNAEVKHKIPNCTSLMSKRPRFPYESFTVEEFEELLCRCGLPCECPAPEEEKEKEVKCMARTPKCLYKGPTPRDEFTKGLSAPSKRDRGFEIRPDGTAKRLFEMAKEQCPPFYDTRVHEATEFYRGWKWSKRTSSRTMKSSEVRPGPADYDIDRSTPPYCRCLEKIREERRLTAKLLRYTEAMQHRTIKEGLPGPPHYHPHSPKGTDLKSFGPKAERFPTSEYDQCPGPTTYTIKRAFDVEPPIAQPYLPPPAGFGVKASRFKYRVPEGPGPADYDAGVKLCRFQHCGRAPFGVSAQRFKHSGYNVNDEDETDEDEKEDDKKPCPKRTWQFKSQTSRFKPPHDVFEPSWSKQQFISERSPRSQYLAPFFTSEGRFQPWKDWLPIFGSINTPGPGYYNLEKPKCPPAVCRGPLYRCQRFVDHRFNTPAPNEYRVDRGIETVLATHNRRLKDNIKNQHKFEWREPPDIIEQTPAEREAVILERAVSQLETDVIAEKFENLLKVNKGKSVLDTCKERLGIIKEQAISEAGDKPTAEGNAHEKGDAKETSDAQGKMDNKDHPEIKDSKQQEKSEPKQKLLRTFLYRHPQPMYI
ncbi:sperm-tail PG-rich repeat-containing protein 2-like [Pectinophora gossypiella]|uniref:sperm-tail PG-rich repeat-containing protein 2-like n=1 Tax=Pectinophora gossypiella TaxID=13191 RepID=UPI00214E2CB5|nr:sperm-tail PG-rich repeat-containing protein 2-like [Pectinophora gossypiella]